MKLRSLGILLVRTIGSFILEKLLVRQRVLELFRDRIEQVLELPNL